MREIDRIAIEDTGPNLFQMMENAGRNLALHALDVLGTDWRDRHTLVLAAPGEMVAAASALPVSIKRLRGAILTRRIESCRASLFMSRHIAPSRAG